MQTDGVAAGHGSFVSCKGEGNLLPAGRPKKKDTLPRLPGRRTKVNRGTAESGLPTLHATQPARCSATAAKPGPEDGDPHPQLPLAATLGVAWFISVLPFPPFISLPRVRIRKLMTQQDRTKASHTAIKSVGKPACRPLLLLPPFPLPLSLFRGGDTNRAYCG
jgi:hypothetical protein